MMEVSYPDWLEAQNWIKKGDCVYVISDILELAKTYRVQGEKLQLSHVVEKLQELVGEEGTLLFPTFNWDFCKGIAFDYYKTPCRTGALSTAALKHEGFQRTAHPIYSFAVWGKKQAELMENDAVDSFGPGTIFEKLYDWNAKALVIGIPPLSGLTYIHHVEQVVGVPFRYHKTFTADYTTADGVCTERSYRMYVRDLDIDPKEINGFAPLGEIMERDGLIRKAYYSGVPSEMLYIRDADTAARKDILENEARNMYDYER